MRVTLLSMLLAGVSADVYMHMPRGSNNRLNERSANRNNGNRAFDSQNNNRGGYNKGDVDDDAAQNNFVYQYDMVYYQSDSVANGGKSYMPIEWTNQHGCGGGEEHDPHKLNCDIIIQYMAVPVVAERSTSTKLYDYLDREEEQIIRPYEDAVDRTAAQGNDETTHECFIRIPSNPNCEMHDMSAGRRPCPSWTGIATSQACARVNGVWQRSRDVDGMWDEFNTPQKTGTETLTLDNTRRRIRDGVTTNRQQFTNGQAYETQVQRGTRKTGDVDDSEVLHELWEMYDECYRRERNKGLFTADQNLRNNQFGYSSAVYTRQNPNNNRRGYECPEERDHYPYWHPTEWRDIVVMTDHLDRCDFYKTESQNVREKNVCRQTPECDAANRNCIRYNNEKECVENQGRWATIGAWNTDAPECIQAPWSRVNHLGNGRYGQANSYNWTMPHFGYDDMDMKIIVRLRYNISTDDYDGTRVNSSFNNRNGQNIQSPVRQNPAVDIGAVNSALRLAINTAQFGRTFQDRSHVLTLKSRPMANTKRELAVATDSQSTAVPDPAMDASFFTGNDIWPIYVRGKRGNIVQTFPSVEYDFMPNHLNVSTNDIVYFQWTGSNTHNNGNPAGDGQAGDAGEGTRGTDRHNVVEMMSRDSSDFGGSFPTTWERTKMWKNVRAAMSQEPTIREMDRGKSIEELQSQWAIRMSTAGYYTGHNSTMTPTNPTGMYMKRGGGDTRLATDTISVLLNNAPASYPGALFKFNAGHYYYMCTRNHNFSNRDQKGILKVTDAA